MIGRAVFALEILSSFVLAPCAVLPCAVAPLVLHSAAAHAQDIPGIEICTVEKTMERRTSCLQSNIDFLQKSTAKLAADHQQKIDAARAQVENLKATVIALQKIVDDLRAAQKKVAEDPKTKTDAPAKEAPQAKDVPVTRDAAPAAKEGEKK